MTKRYVTHFFDSKNIHLNPRIILGIWENRDTRHEHTFVISFMGSKNKEKELSIYNELVMQGCSLVFSDSVVDLARLIVKTPNIMILHGSLSPFKMQFLLFLIFYCFLRKTLSKIVLVAWGSEEFSLSKNVLGAVYLKIVSNFKKIVTLSRVDYQCCYNLYGDLTTQISYIKWEGKSSVIDNQDVLRKKRIMVSHSGWIHNDHIKSFELIKDRIDSETEVVCPLAYGDKAHIDLVIKKGLELFGDSFVYFTELMSIADYQRLLSTIDIYVTCADIQTGLFAVKSCLQNGVKIYCGSNLYKSLVDCGFKVFSVDDIDSYDKGYFYCMKKEDVEINKTVYMKEFGDVSGLKDKWNSVYDLAIRS